MSLSNINNHLKRMKINSIKLALLSILTLSSCSDSFLDTVPTDTYNEENFWKTEAHVVSAINGCYAVTRGYKDYKLNLDNISPNSYNQSGQIQLAEGKHDAGNDDWFNSIWKLNYQGVGRVNNLLANIEPVNMDAALKKRITGEALFLRALFYFDLANYFGGVPLILDGPSLEEQGKLPRNKQSEVLSQILTDLTNAAAALPVSYSGADKGRATRGAALALKARVLLHESRWAEAAQSAKEVMQLNYSLFADYRQLFMIANEGNPEVIFDVQFAAPDYVHGWNLTLDLQLNVAPLPDLVNSYLMKDGLPSDTSPLFNAAKPYENRDPRLLKTIAMPGYQFKGVTVSDTKYYSTGFGYKKYTTYEDDTKYASDVTNSALNFIVLRYADVLLMYAEAQNEAVGAEASVYEALNKIRKRAGMPDVTPGLSKDDLRKVIRLERRIELAGEGLYYDDIRRWKTAEVVMNTKAYNSKGTVIQTRSFNRDRDYLWPLHSIVIEQNPALEQNPGYSK
ncbi:RagB/SusD family nutrient uptake outer membrane protein [Dyadobacter sp. CY323]|uniref:RagB/SusD family nutrient uptake outer membrane protein n=1 Tax=Dyadobacter sp. CY323 TaxID=2907302 RepID=UPI001F36993D|nr:RagB/SusD family nutrient uptake outer membrane protein [Dyadobacter sp. CY323]MCE6991111.1 RagB/SusD family nutrient uptake outer membrane protein [Dyadobacter sp. CY323]